MVVNQKELSQCLGISTRQIRNLKSEGLFQTEKNSRGYNLEKCVREYINFKINAEMGRRTNITKEEVQAEHEEVKKQISVLKLRKLRRELHEASDVEAFLTDMLIRFRNRLLSLPPKLAMQLSGINDLNDMIKAIKTELENTLEELSQYDPDEIDGVNPGDIDVDDPEEEDEEEEE
ncbi:DNA-packaging protein [Enterocloster clostridioformis]|uniref:DNA-packaging protein n=1 Tax=Enterocloster clostridioformis TaxID=1531 RepID=UPI001F357E1C|nr:DNA-packaging protein [Enterocloster clostridioformis]MCF2704192.1 DNA-packaging protein [Enterocloster clostridioformis]